MRPDDALRSLAAQCSDLDGGLGAIVESLAENVHDTWAHHRRVVGWSQQAGGRGEAATHPGLVPYAELSESEKAIDRAVVLSTLRAILKQGFIIERRAPVALNDCPIVPEP